jgi:hypothetical protein
MNSDVKERRTLAELRGCALIIVFGEALVWWALEHTPAGHDTGLRTLLLLAPVPIGLAILCTLDFLRYQRSRLATAGIIAGLVSSPALVALVLQQA